MKIVIDTNIIFNDWALRTEDAEAFLDFVDRTGSVIYIPRIVWEETRKNYREQLKIKHDAYVQASRQFGRTMINQPDLTKIQLDYDGEADKYLEWLQKKLKFDGNKNILPYGDFTERIANRVMAKRKPFNLQNSNEFKDTLVWETVIDIVAKNSADANDEIVLISNDANAFGASREQQKDSQERNKRAERKKGVLHPQLQEEIDSILEETKGNNFYYYESFAEFLAAHYTHIKGINEKFVREFLQSNDSGFEQVLLQELKTRRGEITAAIQSINSVSYLKVDVDNFKISSVSQVQDFYVYSFQRGEVVRASGSLLVYLNANVDYGYSSHRIFSKADIQLVVQLKFILPYLNEKPSVVQFESISIPISAGLRLPERPKSSWDIWLEQNRDFDRPVSALIGNAPYFQSFKDDVLSYRGDVNRAINWDDWIYESSFVEAKSSDFKNPSSKFIPAKGIPVPYNKSTPSKRKKKGAKKR